MRVNIFKREIRKGIQNLPKLVFLLRKFENGLTEEEIEQVIPNQRSNTSNLLKPLKECNLVEGEYINHTRNGSRKKFKYNSDGMELAHDLFQELCNEEEKRLNIFLKEMRNFHNKDLVKDFWDLIDLFYEYGFNKSAFNLSEMLRDRMAEIRKFFKYEKEFTFQNDEISV